MRRYMIYCDESEDKGRYYGNFYGGALVRAEDLEFVEAKLKDRVAELGLMGEIKWSKTTTMNYSSYMRLIETFFELIRADLVKIRIMFTQNAHEAIDLTAEQRGNEYYLLYYQFIKHAFGLAYSNPTKELVRVEIAFDQLPNNHGHRQAFKEYILKLQYQSDFKAARITMTPDDLSEIDSGKHIILQCLDVIMGSMNFRLNDLYKVKPVGSRTRGKKTIVKEKLYKRINALICEIRPHFNIGDSTGTDGDVANRWRHPYRHWKFLARGSQYVPERTKKQEPRRPYI